MKGDITLHETRAWMEDEGHWEILTVRDGHEYRMGEVYNRSAYMIEDGDRYKDWIRINNLDELELILDSVYDYLNVGEESSSEESNSDEVAEAQQKKVAAIPMFK